MSYSRVRKLAAALALVLISGAASAGTATTTFPVSATAVAACTVSATPLNFGTFATLANNVEAINTLTVNCALGVGYNVMMSAGTGVGATFSARKLTANGGFTLDYSIFPFLTFPTPWGDGTALSSVTGSTGTGLDQIFSPVGRIFSGQPIPATGAYTDTITVTVAF